MKDTDLTVADLYDEELVSFAWHWIVEDGLGWDFVSGYYHQCNRILIPPKEYKKIFLRYFKNLTNITPYTPCPVCNSQLLPRRSDHGYFVGCSKYPSCRFIATNRIKFEKTKNGI